MNLLKKIVIFAFSNFGPLIGFYFINYFWGFKIAIITSIVLVVLEFLILKYRKKYISNFFYFSSIIIIVFGIADLILKEPLFFKFEASLTNLFFAAFFGLSLFKEKPIVQEFAEMQKRTSFEQNPDKLFFFKFFTVLWCFYFILKAVFYLWMNFYMSIDEGMIVRMFVGKISFWIMMFISIGMPKKIWSLLERLKLFPSQRKLGL